MNATSASPTSGPRLIIGVIGHDIHVVANRIIAIALRESGFNVCNLGVDNTAENFLDAAFEYEAAAVVVSSLNGEAEHWCRGFGSLFERSGKRGVLRYLGGNLVVGDQDRLSVEEKFLKFGFHRVFHRPDSLAPLFDSLKEDLLLGRG
jgi:methylaspartate mutase sigma subunit